MKINKKKRENQKIKKKSLVWMHESMNLTSKYYRKKQSRQICCNNMGPVKYHSKLSCFKIKKFEV